MIVIAAYALLNTVDGAAHQAITVDDAAVDLDTIASDSLFIAADGAFALKVTGVRNHTWTTALETTGITATRGTTTAAVPRSTTMTPMISENTTAYPGSTTSNDFWSHVIFQDLFQPAIQILY
jgi:hypothetical protein